MNFWKKLKKPFLSLAPMDEVTDVVFREIVAGTSRPDVFFTEFTNVDALNSKGRESQLPRLRFTENQRPIVAQIWGRIPENYFKVAQELVKMGFDGIDINMGCPDKSVRKSGSCSALIQNPELARDVIQATKAGAGDLPVSVKTRLGVSKIMTEEWIGFLLAQDLQAITIHGRTVAEMSKVDPHWDEIGKAVKLRDNLKKDTVIIGNGGIKSRREALEKSKEFGVDGVMIGTGIFKNIFIFDGSQKEHAIDEMLKILLRHAQMFDNTWGIKKNFLIMRKFFKVYIHEFEGAADLREKLMQANSYQETKKMVEDYLA